MQIVKRILKELIIACLMVGIVLLACFLLFKNFLFLGSSVPNPVKYDRVNLADYGVVSDDYSLENQSDPPKKYEATNNSLRTMTEERRVSTGAPNPFVISEQADPDIPTEIVTITNDLTGETVSDTSSGDAAK